MDHSSGGRLYYHAYHRNNDGIESIDIGSCCLASNGEPREQQAALSPAGDPAAWDTYFVADPFVVMHP